MNKRKLAGFAVGPIGAAALSFLIVPLIAWSFPAEDVGRIAMLQVGISFSLLLFSLGLDQAFVREYHEASHKSALLLGCTLPGLLLLLVALLLFAFDPLALPGLLFGMGQLTDGLLLALCLVLAYVSRFLSLVLRMEERGLTFSLSQLLPKVGFLCVISLFIFATTDRQFRQLLIAHSVAFSTVTVWLLWITRETWRHGLAHVTALHWKRLANFGTPLVFSGLAFWGITSLDRILLSRLSTFEQLGLYSVACSFAGVAVVLQSIFSTVWAPLIYKKASEGQALSEVHSATRHLLAVVVIIFTLIGSVSGTMKHLLPTEYFQAERIICACLAYPLLYTLSEATGIGLGIRRRSMLSMTATLIALCANLLLCVAIIPKFGAAGAACSTAISFFILLIIRTEFSSRCWAQQNRIKIYLETALCVSVAVCHALMIKVDSAYFNVTWFLLLIYFAIRHRQTLSSIRTRIVKTPS